MAIPNFQDILNNSIAYVQANSQFFYTLMGLIVGLKIFEVFLVKYIKRIAKKTKNDFDDIIINYLETLPWFFYVYLAFFISAKSVVFPEVVNNTLKYITVIFFVWVGLKFIVVIIENIRDKQIKKRKKEEGIEDTSFIRIVATLIKIMVYVLATLLVLSNFGFNVNSLIAGIGVGGIAIAFALQNVLEDLFSAFTIYFDKPFREGDYIVIGGDSGTIKKIGLKTTRIQTLQGQELVVSNRELTSTRINNYKKMKKRRIVFPFGVEYGTPQVKLKKINNIVADIIKKVKLASLDRVHFKEFADSSLNYEVVYYLNSSEYTKFMDTQEEINLALNAAFSKEKISMAFPTRTVHIVK